jgi:hypothetical protein
VAGIRQSLAQQERYEAFVEEHGLADDIEVGHYIIQNIKRRLVRWGSISDAQINLVRKIARETRERAQQQEEDRKNATPVVEGRGIDISGEIISVKEKPGFGYNSVVWKMTVKDDRGFLVWGSVPECLWEQVRDCTLRGRRVSFKANVEKSDRDEHFGFFKRPRKAEIVEEVAE